MGGRVTAVAFDHGGTLLAAVEGEEVIRRWTWPGREALEPWTGYLGGVRDLLVSPDGTVLAAWCGDDNLRLRDLRRGASLPVAPVDNDVPAMEFSPDGRFLAVGAYDARPGVSVWEVRGARVDRWFGPGAHGWCWPAFSPDGQRLVAPGARAKLDLWDLNTMTRLAELDWPGVGPSSVSFSRDGHTVAITDRAGTLRLWNSFLRREVATVVLAGQSQVLFSPDGNLLAVRGTMRQNLLLHAAGLAEIEAELAGKAPPALISRAPD